MIPSDETLRQIASDAKVHPARFVRFVRDHGLTILQAVQACRDVRKAQGDMNRVKQKSDARKRRQSKQRFAAETRNAKDRQRRQAAANDYVENAWRFDER